MGTNQGAGSNPLAGGSSAEGDGSNPLAGAIRQQIPASGAPAAGQNANPPAGGQTDGQTSPNDDDNAPVPLHKFREKERSEAALRRRVQELEQYRTEQENAKLTTEQRTANELAAYKAKEAAWVTEKQTLLLDRAVSAAVWDKNLQDASVVRALLQSEYGDQIDYDDEQWTEQIPGLIDRLVTKHSFLKREPDQAPPPASGRQVNPPRNPQTGQYQARAQAKPTDPKEWKRLGDLSDDDWAPKS